MGANFGFMGPQQDATIWEDNIQEKENKSTDNSSNFNRQIEIVECRFRQKQKPGNQSKHLKIKTVYVTVCV